MQMVKLVLELRKHDREQYCRDDFFEDVEDLEKLEGVSWSERQAFRERRRSEELREYWHEGYWIPQAATAAGEESVIEVCDKGPGFFLVWLEKYVLEEV